MRRVQVRESAPVRGSSKFKGVLGRRECREQEEDGDDVRSRRGEVFELGTGDEEWAEVHRWKHRQFFACTGDLRRWGVVSCSGE